MQAIVTLITAAAFVLHFALGCCAHHAHAAEATACPDHANVSTRVQHCHGHCGHGHNSQQQGEQTPGDPDSPASQCNGPSCVFMAAGKTVIAKTAFIAVLPHFTTEIASFASLSPLAVASIDSGGLIGPPVRTHLFLQVLLI